MKIENLIDKIVQTQRASAEELVEILQSGADSYLFQKADEVCRRHHGNVVKIRSILEFSNYCRRTCRYCGINAANQNCKRYRMTEQEMLETAIDAYRAGYQTIVLQSGEDLSYTAEALSHLIRQIKSHCSDMAITLSIGERPIKEYRLFREAGVDRYLIKQEVSDPQIYRNLHPDSCLAKRIRCLSDLKSLGFETGSGFMIGLPGQTFHTIAQDILLLQSIPCDMAGIGPFIPHPDTELKALSPGDTHLTKQAVALTRLLLPAANLPATTSLGVLDREEKESIFSCGANVIMKKVTPWNHRRQYALYPADFGEVIDTKTARRQLEEEIRALGKTPV